MSIKIHYEIYLHINILHVYIHTKEYYTTLIKYETWQFATTCVKLDEVMLSEESLKEKYNIRKLTHFCTIMKQTTKLDNLEEISSDIKSTGTAI